MPSPTGLVWRWGWGEAIFNLVQCRRQQVKQWGVRRAPGVRYASTEKVTDCRRPPGGAVHTMSGHMYIYLGFRRF